MEIYSKKGYQINAKPLSLHPPGTWIGAPSAAAWLATMSIYCSGALSLSTLLVVYMT